MSKKKLWRKFVGAVAVGALAATGFAALQGTAVAETAAGGASIHKDNIFWWTAEGSGTEDFSAQILSSAVNPETGKPDPHTSTAVSKIGDSELAVTCTISNLGVLEDGSRGSGVFLKTPTNPSGNGTAQDKGGWKGEALGLLYNSGDASNNLLANGMTFAAPLSNMMRNRVLKANVKAEWEAGVKGPWTEQVEYFGGRVLDDGSIDESQWPSWPEDTEFDLSCTATLDGVPVPLDGLVVANAESNGFSNSDLAKSEYQQFTPIGEGANTATWHALDIWNACNPASDVYSISSDNVLTNRPVVPMKECANAADKSFTSSALLSGSTGVHVKMHEPQGLGESPAGAIAVGVYLSSDFGDAPSSYGIAGNYWSGTWTNALQRGNDYVLRNLEGAESQGGVYSTGSSTSPNYYLGSKRDTESPETIELNNNADGDDTSADGDEDSFPSGKDITKDIVSHGDSFTYSYDVPCTADSGTGYVGGWIDWNLDGEFNTASEQATAQCTAGKAALTWNVAAGEVEPWIQRTNAVTPGTHPTSPNSYLRLRISSNPDDIQPYGIGNGEGEVEDHKITWKSDVAVSKDAEWETGKDPVPGTKVTWTVTLRNKNGMPFSDEFPMGFDDDLTDVLKHVEPNSITVEDDAGGNATVDLDNKKISWLGAVNGKDEVEVTISAVIARYDDGILVNRVASKQEPNKKVSAEIYMPHMKFTKTADPAGEVKADGTIHYTITITNDGEGTFEHGSAIDDMSDVLDDATMLNKEITGGFKDATLTLDGTNLVFKVHDGAQMGPGESSTIEYDLKVNGSGNGNLANKVCPAAPWADKGEEDCVSTSTNILYPPTPEDRVTVDKKGEKQSTTIEDMFEKGTGEITDYTLLDPETGEPTDTVTIDGEGTYTMEDGKVVFTPEPDFTGTPTPVTVRATDENGLTAEGEYQPHVLDEGTATRTITYHYLTEDGEEASTTVVQTTEFEQIPVLDEDGKPQFNEDGTPKYTWQPKAGQSDTLPAVESPDLSDTGWYPNKDSIPAVTVQPGDELTEVVVYTPEPPVGTPDETWGGKDQPQTGTPEFEVTTSTTPDGSPNEIVKTELLDENGNPVTEVTVPEGKYVLNEDGTITFTPNEGFVGDPTPVKVRGTDKNGLTAETTYTPHVADNVQTDTAKRTITYHYLTPDGETASETVVQEVNFERTGAVDPKTGEVTWPEWTPKTVDEVVSPDLSSTGWTPDKTTVPSTALNPGDDVTEVVVYTPEPPVGTPNETWGGKDQPQTGTPKFEVTTSTTPDGSPNEIVKTELLDENGNPVTEVTVPEGKYVLNEDGTITFTPNEGFVGDPTPVKVRGTDKNGLTAETTYTPHVVDNVQTDTAKRTVKYWYEKVNGEPAFGDAVQTVTFERTGAVDPKTGEVTWPEWTPKTVDEVVSTDLSDKGWKYDRAVVDATDLKPGDDITEHVIYTTTWVTYVDEDGTTIYLEKTDLDKDGNEPPAPKDPTKDGYTFTGWTRTVDDEGNVTYTAHWEPVEEPTPEPTPSDDPTTPEPVPWVTYVDEDGNTVYLEQTDFDENGNEPPAPKDPTKDGFKFTGWDREVDEDGNVTYTAHWEPEPTPTDSGTPNEKTSNPPAQPNKPLATTGTVVGVTGILTLALLGVGAGLLALRRRK